MQKNLVSKIIFDMLKIILNFLVLADVKVAPGKFPIFIFIANKPFFYILCQKNLKNAVEDEIKSMGHPVFDILLAT